MSVEAYASAVLDEIRGRGTHRRMRVLGGAQSTRMSVDGREILLFAGSNYLDLAHHPEVVEAAARAASEFGCAAGGSRLISGNLEIHEALEAELAETSIRAEADPSVARGCVVLETPTHCYDGRPERILDAALHKLQSEDEED